MELFRGIFFVMIIRCGQGSNSCQEYFEKENSCPEIDLYTKLNADCCKADTTTELHCIAVESSNGIMKVHHACLNKTLVPKGHSMTFDSLDSPKRILVKPCTRGWYEPEDQPSTEIRNDMCSQSKTICSGDGCALFCDGGPAADNQFGCGEGYQPQGEAQCWKGFNQNDNCDCKEKKCPPGTARNLIAFLSPGLCPRNRSEIDYRCHPVPSTTPTPQPTGGATTPVPGSGSTTVKTDQADAEQQFWRCLRPCLIVLGLLIFIGVLVLLYRHRTRAAQRFSRLVAYFKGQNREMPLSITYTAASENPSESGHDSRLTPSNV